MNNTQSTIEIDLSWNGCDDATHLYWVSDDGQGVIEGGVIDTSKKVASQALAFSAELMDQGHDGSGRIVLGQE
jgi:hypothetical protein